MIRIGEFSKIAKTTVKSLRFYDEIGLFKPEFVDDNGYRYYSIEQLTTLQRILDLREVGMPIDEIKKILDGEDVVSVLNVRRNALKYEMTSCVQQLSLIDNWLNIAKKGVFMSTYQANLVSIPEGIVYVCKGVIEDHSRISAFVLAAGEEVKAHNPNLKCTSPGYCFVTYTANEYTAKDVELEYAEAVETFGTDSEHIKFKKLPGVKAVSVIHKGSYSQLGKAYAYAVNWTKENGFEIAAPIRECYIDGCWNKSDEKDYLTEIQIPIK